MSGKLVSGKRFGKNIPIQKRNNNIFSKGIESVSGGIMKIANQDVVQVECNAASGSYANDKSSHTIREFATNKLMLVRNY